MIRVVVDNMEVEIPGSLWRYGKQKYARLCAPVDYRREEQSILEVTHVNQGTSGEIIHWLKSYGLTDWTVISTPVRL